jgi:hypothetical protein
MHSSDRQGQIEGAQFLRSAWLVKQVKISSRQQAKKAFCSVSVCCSVCSSKVIGCKYFYQGFGNESSIMANFPNETISCG